MSIGTVTPDLDNTFSPEEVRRKTFEEKYATAFNKDQREVLDALISGGFDQVQSDWEQVDDTAVDFIKNKPTIPEPGSEVSWDQEVQEGTKIATITIDGNEQDVYAPEGGGGEQVQSDWNVSDTSSAAFIKNKPSIPAEQVQADWNVTSSSSKAFIKNKPAVPRLAATKNVFLGGKSTPLSRLDSCTSYSDGIDIQLTSVFSFGASDWQTKTPSQLVVVFPISRIVSSFLDNERNFLTFTRDTSLGSDGTVRYTCKVSGSDFAHMSLPSNDRSVLFWFENATSVERLFPSPDLLNTVWSTICSLYNPTLDARLGDVSFQIDVSGAISTAKFSDFNNFNAGSRGNVFVPMFLFYRE